LGFVFAGMHLYQRGATTNRADLTGASLVIFALGILAHYMNLVFAAFFAIHFVYFAFRKHWNWKQILYPVGISAALVGSWVLFLVLHFGMAGTLTANSTFGSYINALYPNEEPPTWGEVFVGNVISTFVPYSMRHNFPGLANAPYMLRVDALPAQVPPKPTALQFGVANRADPTLEMLCDLANDTDTIPGEVGFAGLLGLLLVIWKRPKSRDPLQKDPPGEQPGRTFWILFFIIGIPVNIFFCRVSVPHGLAHINLQPYVCLLAVFLIRMLKDSSRVIRFLLGGIFLLESALLTACVIVLEERPVGVILDNTGRLSAIGKIGVNHLYLNNYVYKLQVQAVYLSDYFGDV